MKIALPGPGPGFARVAMAAHGEDEEEERTTTLTTTVEVTATAGTVTVTPVSVPTVTRAAVGTGGRAGAVRVAAVVESPGPGISEKGGEASRLGMGLYCPGGEEARGYCCSDVNPTGSGLPGGGGGDGGGAVKGVECKSPAPEPHASLPLAE